mmetsp:Transcript_28192/g.61788  ORF Transcript_28192/g.61788 Transcript_28192/m.61788 type:complete len:248 (-) Transcript_28192:1432-2175(-)
MRAHLMAEVADASGEERHAVLVAAVYGVLITHGPPGVHDGRNARLARLLHRVAPREGEEGVRGHHATLHLLPGLLERDLHALDAVGLAGAHAQHAVALGDGDGVGLDVLHAGPGELDVLHLLLGGLLLARHRELDLRRLQRVHVLVEPAAAHLAQLTRPGDARRRLQDAQRLGLALQLGQPGLRVGGRHHNLVEHARLVVCGGAELAELGGELLGDGAVEGDDASEGGDGVRAHGQAVRLQQVLAAV